MARTAVTQSRQTINNLVRNGDFEYAPAFTAATNTGGVWVDGTAAGSTASSSPYGWGTVAILGGSTAEFDSVEKHSGSYSLKCVSPASSSLDVRYGAKGSAASNAPYSIPVSPLTSYTFTCWFKTSVTTPGSGAVGCRVNLVERTGAYGFVVANNVTEIFTTTGWTSYTLTITTSATTAYLLPSVLVGDGTQTRATIAWLDDITLSPTTPITRDVV